jgi:hypothetical protein
VATVEMSVQALDEAHITTSVFNKRRNILDDVKRVYPFVTWFRHSASFGDESDQHEPSVQPLSGPAKLPLAFRASMKPVSLLYKVKGAF